MQTCEDRPYLIAFADHPLMVPSLEPQIFLPNLVLLNDLQKLENIDHWFIGTFEFHGHQSRLTKRGTDIHFWNIALISLNMEDTILKCRHSKG